MKTSSPSLQYGEHIVILGVVYTYAERHEPYHVHQNSGRSTLLHITRSFVPMGKHQFVCRARPIDSWQYSHSTTDETDCHSYYTTNCHSYQASYTYSYHATNCHANTTTDCHTDITTDCHSYHTTNCHSHITANKHSYITTDCYAYSGYHAYAYYKWRCYPDYKSWPYSNAYCTHSINLYRANTCCPIGK